MATTNPRRRNGKQTTGPNGDGKSHICFWLDAGLHRDYLAALAAKASSTSLDLRAHINRTVAAHQVAQAAGKEG